MSDAPNVEVVIYDEDAEALAEFFLPPSGSEVPPEELHDACRRLALMVSAVKKLRRTGRTES